jgi:hypothetical protein
MQHLHADRLRAKYRHQVFRPDAILGDKALEDMQALGREHVNAPVLEGRVLQIGRVLDNVRFEKVRTDRLCHFARH